MVIKVIEQNYIYKHKVFQLFKVACLIYFTFLLIATLSKQDDYIHIYEQEIRIISTVFFCLILGFKILNSIFYSRIGEIIIKKDNIIINKQGWNKILPLEDVNILKVENVHGKEYMLIMDKLSINIELSSEEYEKLKNIKTIKEIVFDKPCYISKMINNFKRFGLRNKNFINEINSK